MKSVRSLLQFATIVPMGAPQDFDAFAKHSWLFPIAGYIIALLVSFPLFFITDRTLASAIAVAGVLILSGAHHFDGLLDFGDGLMAHGDREKRIRALTDRYVGAGGIAAGIVVTLLLFAGFLASASIIPVLILGEVCAKFSMAFLTVYGTPFREGMHSYIHQFAKPYFPILSLILCAPLLFLPIPPFRIAVAAAVMIACPAVLLSISQRLFGGVNGDVVGAANEITRALVVVAVVLV